MSKLNLTALENALSGNAPAATPALSGESANPNVRTFLDFLGKAEGADYDMIVGGGRFNDFSRHPNVVGLRTAEGPSTAAGKYQITGTTYRDFAPRLGITDFSPESQDQIALAIIESEGALDDVKAGNFDAAIQKLGGRWASLPSSPYSQPKRDQAFVDRFLGANSPKPAAVQPTAKDEGFDLSRNPYAIDFDKLEEAMQADRRQAAADESPIGSNLSRGWRQMTDAVENYGNLLAGNEAAIAENVAAWQEFDKQNPQPTSTREFLKDFQDENYIAAIANPAGFFGASTEQLANSIPSMMGSIPGMIVGGKLGAAAGPVGVALGAALGGAIGSAPGSVAIETGARIGGMMSQDGVDMSNAAAVQDWLRKNSDKVLEEGAKKGLTVAAVDGLSGGIGAAIVMRPLLKFRVAHDRILRGLSINPADAAAVQAAIKTPQYMTAIKPFRDELVAANTIGQNAMRGAASFASETMGEGGGEYLGELAATGEGSFNEAALEAVLAGGTSTATTAAQFAGRKLTGGVSDIQQIIDSTASVKPPEPKPNSPLQNAANAAAASAPQAPAGGAAPVVDPLAVSPDATADAAVQAEASEDPRLARARSFVEDRTFINALRSADGFGKESVADLLSAYAKARNPNVDAVVRERALADIDRFINTFVNRPNFTFGKADPATGGAPGTAVAPSAAPSAVTTPSPRDDGMTIDGEFRTPAERMAGANPNQIAAPPVLGLPTAEALQAKRDADAAYDQAYQDLVKAEQLGASEAELLAYQQSLLEAQQQREELAAQLAEADARTAAARERESTERRRALLAEVIAAGVDPVNPVSGVAARFTAELQRQGYRQIVPTEDEMRMIQRAADVANARQDVAKATPNEMPADIVPEKAVQSPASQRSDKVAEVLALLGQGWKLKGKTLESPKGKRRILNLKEQEAVRNALAQTRDGAGRAVALPGSAQPEAEAAPEAVGVVPAAIVETTDEGGVTNDVPTIESVAGEAQEARGQEGEAAVDPWRESSINRGYDTEIEVDARALKAAFERNGEPIAWSDAKADAVRRGAKSNGLPEVSINEGGPNRGGIGINDGRHRIAVAAERGEKIKIMAPAGDVEAIRRAMTGGVTAPADAFDVSGRTDAQLRVLVESGKPGWREAAIAEVARRGAAAAEQPTQAPQEPWQLTRDEFLARRGSTYRARYEAYQGTPESRTQPMPTPDAAQKVAGVIHANAVKKAVASGLDVPQSVLADYPELRAEQPTQAPIIGGIPLIERLGEPPHLNYRVQRTAINGANILPPVGKKFTREEFDSLKEWLYRAGFSVAASKGGSIHIIGNDAPSIPDGVSEKRAARIAEEEKARTEQLNRQAANRDNEYASLSSSGWIESVLGSEFANAHNKLMLARFLDGKDEFKGLGSGAWLDPLQRLGFDTTRSDILMAEVLAFLKQKYLSFFEESKAEQPTQAPTTPEQPMPAPDPRSEPAQPSSGRAYTPPQTVREVDQSWQGVAQRGTTPNQDALMASVQKALDAGLSYNSDVHEFVAKDLGITDAERAADKDSVEGGAFGYDAYHARKEIDRRKAVQANIDAVDELGLAPGKKLGVLVFNDFKTTKSVEVESVTDDKQSVTITGSRGAAKVRGTMAPVAIKNAIERAEERRARKPAEDETDERKAKRLMSTPDRTDEESQWLKQYVEGQKATPDTPAADLAGEKLNAEWTAFAPETGTLGIPRDQMPQIKAEHRGAMTNFMNARGVDHRAEEVPAELLKPTQAEFSPEKVKQAMEFEGGDRSILVSADGYVLDGHHQWLAKRETGEPIKVIRLDAPIETLVPLALEFPSSTTADTSATSAPAESAPEQGEAADTPQPITSAPFATFEQLKTALKVVGDVDALKERMRDLNVAIIPGKGAVNVPNKLRWDEVRANIPVRIDTYRLDGVPDRLADVTLEVMESGAVVLKSAAGTMQGADAQAALRQYVESYKGAPEAADATPGFRAIKSRPFASEAETLLALMDRATNASMSQIAADAVRQLANAAQESGDATARGIGSFLLDNALEAINARKINAGTAGVTEARPYQQLKASIERLRDLEIERLTRVDSAPAASGMDEATSEHLKQWVGRHIIAEERDAVESGIRAFVAENPDMIDIGWTTVRDRAESEGYIQPTAQQATHKDPGLPAEPVTQPVITQAIQKSARNTDFNPTEAKAWLIGEIDRAIAAVPAEHADLQSQMEREHKNYFDYKAAEKTFGKGSKKIIAARDAFDNARDARIAKIAEQIGFVTFDVPGDGKFKVVNTVEKLRDFRAKVEKSPGFAKSPDRPMTYGSGMAGAVSLDAEIKRIEGLSVVDRRYQGGDVLEEIGNAIEIARLRGKEDDALLDRFKENSGGKSYDDWRAEREAEEEIAAREAAQREANKPTEAEQQAFMDQLLAVNAELAQQPKAPEFEFTAKDIAGAFGDASAFLRGRMYTPAVDKQHKAKLASRLVEAGMSKREAGAVIESAQTLKAQESRGAGPMTFLGLKYVLRAASDRGLIAPVNTDGRTIEQERPADPKPQDADAQAEQRAAETPSIDYKGFERTPLGNGAFELRDGNMTVRVEPTEAGKFQASFRGAKSSPHLQGEQGAVDWADAYRAESGRAQASEPAATAALSGPRRDPTKVSAFTPYIAGDVVTLDGQDWQVQQDMGGWYLTNTGNWRGMHPTIQKIRGMNELIAEIEKAATEQIEPASAAPEPTTEQEADDRLTAEQARALMTWEDRGQRDNVRRMNVLFFENAEDMKAGRGGMVYGTIESYQGGKWNIDGTTYPTLKAAKAAAVERAIERLRGDGYAVEASAPAEESPAAEPAAAPAADDGVVPDRIGERLAGGRKDRAALQEMTAELTDEQIASLPFSKVWPAESIDKIEDKFVAAVAHAARSIVPAKPRKGYRVDAWVRKVKAFREVMMRVLGNVSRDRFMDEMKERGGLDDFQAKVALLEAIDRTQWKRIGGVTEAPNAITFDGREVKKASPYVSVEIDGEKNLFRGASSVADVVERVAEKLGGESHGKKMAFEVRGRPGRYFINKKGDKEYRPLKTFENSKEALQYRDTNYDELVAAWDAVKERDNVRKTDVRREENRERTGKDWRNGRDVTGDDFLTEFGFKGVEFGKWVNQGEGARERQGMLNQAYDALMDLADILGIPPKAISLNGSMGLAFGSRGSGSFAAHFEPSNLVINLTKTRGAGSLAHEWFHSLDNYFARQRGGEVAFTGDNAAYRRDNYITYRPEPMYVHKRASTAQLTKAQLERYRAQNPKSGFYNPENWMLDPKHKDGVRPEVERRFAELVEALDASPMTARAARNDKSAEDGYWSRIIDRGARAFENYVIAKMRKGGYQNDYLANVRTPEEFSRNVDRYPYLLDSEMTPVEDAFDNLFGAMETRETDDGVALFRMADALPETITVDGIERPTMNSEGRQIHPTEEGVRNFWRWLGNSAVTDESGRPVIAYHGTTADIADGAFRPGDDAWNEGIFFTDSAQIAGSVYAGGAAMPNVDGVRAALERMPDAKLEDLAERIRDRAGWGDFWLETDDEAAPYAEQIAEYASNTFDDYEGGTQAIDSLAAELGIDGRAPAAGANVLPAYLNLQNPLIVDGSEVEFDPEQQAEWVAQAKREGRDGLIIRNYSDGGFGIGNDFRSAGQHDVFVAFRPEQIKSATGNNGDFSSENPSVVLRAADENGERVGIRRVDADRFVESFLASYPAAPEIAVVNTFDQLPAFVQQEARNQGQGERDTKGVFVRQDGAPRVYVVANNHSSMADFEATVYHEVAGHAGLRALYGDGFVQKLNQVYVGIGGQGGLVRIMSARGMGEQAQRYIRAIQEARRRDAEELRKAQAEGRPYRLRWTDAMAQAVLTEEVYAHIAEQMKDRPRLRDKFMELVGTIRQWLRDHTFLKLASLGESDLLKTLADARKRLQTPPEGPNGGGRTRTSRGGADAVTERGRLNRNDPAFGSAMMLASRLWIREEAGPAVFSLESEGGALADALIKYARNGSSFVYGIRPVAKGSSIEDVARAFSGDGVEVRAIGKQDAFTIAARSSAGVSTMVMRKNADGTYSINATTANPLGTAGRNGMRLYQALFAYAASNDLTVVPEQTLTPINRLRRTSAMLSAALRGGSTDFAAPHADQGVRAWIPGSFRHNLAALAEAEARMVAERVPAFGQLSIDTTTGQVYAEDPTVLDSAAETKPGAAGGADDAARGRSGGAGSGDRVRAGVGGNDGVADAGAGRAGQDGAGEDGARPDDRRTSGDGAARTRAADAGASERGARASAISDSELENYLSSLGAGRGGLLGHGVGLTTLKRALMTRAIMEGLSEGIGAPSMLYRMARSRNTRQQIDADLAARIERDAEGKSLRDVAQYVADNAPNAGDRLIASRVVQRIKDFEAAGTTFSFNVGHVGQPAHTMLQHATGVTHQRASDTGLMIDVWVNGADVRGRVGVTYETILHELVHAVTGVATQLGDLRQFAGTSLGKASQDLRAVGNAIIAHTNRRFAEAARNRTRLSPIEEAIQRRTVNALATPDEVLSWAMTSREFQDYLETIPHKGGTLWSRFVEVVRDALGLPARADTALSEVLRVADSLFSADVMLMKQMAGETGLNLQVLSGEGERVWAQQQDTDTPPVFRVGDGAAIPRDERRDYLAREAGRGPSPIRQVFSDLFAAFKSPSSNVFGPLHRSISTQLHKAWVNKDFGEVFYLADRFERDVSRFSAEPAALAPTLLPSFDKLRDAFDRVVNGDKIGRMSGKVADAIFEGTLYGDSPDRGRVWTDDELRNRFGLSDDEIKLYREAREAIDLSLDVSGAGLAWQMVRKHIPAMKDAVRGTPADAAKTIELAMLELEDQLRERAGTLNAWAEDADTVEQGDKMRKDAQKVLKQAQAVAEARIAAQGVFKRVEDLKAGGYAPLMRFGKYNVDVTATNDEGEVERIAFYKFETEAEAKMAEQRLRREYPDATVERSVSSEESWKIYKGVDPETVALFAEHVGELEGLEVKDDVLQAWYRDAVNNRSAFKRMIHRKGTDGFDRELSRVVASFVTSNARMSARQFNMADISQALADLQERKVAGDVQDEATKLKEYIDNPTEPFQGLKGWMFAWFLGGSVSSALLNATQPLMMTFPYLSQFGAGKAAAQLARASKEAALNKVDDPDLQKALLRASEDGKVDPQQVHHLFHEGMRPLISKLPFGQNLRARAQGLMTMWGYMFAGVENFNRRSTFIAAYRMAKADPTLGDAYDFAVRAIDETQGIYSKSNRPDWARGVGPFGAVGTAAFSFKQYSIGYIELLIRMAKSGPAGKRAALMQLGILVMLAGIQGFPGADDLEDVIDTVAQYVGYTGNSRLELHRYLKRVMGEEMANIVQHGLLSAPGLRADMSARVGMGNLLPVTAIFKPSQENKASQLAELFGPPASMGEQVLNAMQKFDAGGGALGVLGALAPVAITNAGKGISMAMEGRYDDSRGRKVVETDLIDASLKFIGVQPSVVAGEQRPARMVQLSAQRVRQVKANIHTLRAQAIVEKNADKRARADEMLRDWNEKNPDARLSINASAILRRVKEMNAERRARLMKTLPKELRQSAAEDYAH